MDAVRSLVGTGQFKSETFRNIGLFFVQTPTKISWLKELTMISVRLVSAVLAVFTLASCTQISTSRSPSSSGEMSSDEVRSASTSIDEVHSKVLPSEEPILVSRKSFEDGAVVSSSRFEAIAMEDDAARRSVPRRLLHSSEILFHAAHDDDHEPRLQPNWMVAHFVNVGQGDATLLEFSCGAVLIDTGGERTGELHGGQSLIHYLDDFFERRSDLENTLDLVVLTHPHKDHVLGAIEDKKYKDGETGEVVGAPGLIGIDGLARYTIKNVVDNGDRYRRHSGGYQQNKLYEYANDNEIPYLGVKNTDITHVDGMTNSIIDPIACADVDPLIRVLWGKALESHTWPGKANNDSVVVRVDFGESSFLFTGDLQAPGIREMLHSYSPDPSILDVDVYQVGHHGSHNATTPELMEALSPEIAVISMGSSMGSQAIHSAYGYGHPRDHAVSELLDEEHGVSGSREPVEVLVAVGQHRFEWWEIEDALYGTGWEGNILIYATPDGEFRVETEY